MADLQPVKGQIDFSESDTSGIDTATNALNGFKSALTDVIATATGFDLANISQSIVSMGDTAIQDVSQFQNATTAIGDVLGNLGDSSNTAVQTMSGGAQKISDIAQQEEDLLIKHNEKVAQLQDDIATVMQGQNVIDAQQNMYDQLDTLAEDHAEKIQQLQDQITTIQENETTSLQDSQDQHNVKMQDLAEKHQQEMDNATSDLQRTNLEKKYKQQVQYENDSFQRAFDLKKKEEDQKAAMAIEKVKDEIAKENDAYAEKYAADQKKDEARIAQLESDNAKKLEKYKQELADEDRAYQEHLNKLKEESAKAGSAASNSFTQPLADNSPWKAQKESLQDFMNFVNTFSNNTPFNFKDITEYGRLVETMGYNFQNLAPIISDIAAGTGKTFGVTTQAMMDAVNGRMTMMEMELGINKETLIKYGAEFDKQGHLISQSSLFTALDKLSKTEFKGATEKELHTLGGAYSNVQDAIFKAEAALLGMNTTTGIASGPIKILTDAMINLGTWLNTNHGTMLTWIGDVGKVFDMIGKFLKPALDDLIKVVMKHKAEWLLLAEVLGFAVVGAIGLATYAFFELVRDVTVAIDITLDLVHTLKDLLVDAFHVVIDIIHGNWSQAWKDMGKLVKDVVTDMWNLIKDFFNGVIDGINDLTKGISNVINSTGKSHITISTIPHLATGTDFFPGGTAMVGEHGPEMVNLPRGSQVIPNNKIGQAGAGVTIQEMNNNFYTTFDPVNFAKTLALQLQLVH